ncbi:GGDEF domain-containing protein [Ruminococcus sp. OA3]|uniref:GGDEF domain-containing protein n=1 Tax=Ruminococcus sp. OA3 TaxID=2914164 RepID=UPI001F06A9B9|nr:GGDEF domain-containing protein [Ruminococcus sp. OA3]MCH1983041.1 GGDEF domain-containing protein [Ruminococcus sp. OA3]
MRDRELESAVEAYQRLAERDWLTGLYNRGTMEQKVNDWITAEKAGTLIFLDLDHFKQINDRYGHIKGDSLLQSVGDTLHKMFPEPNLVGRIGGDEFIIFVQHTMDGSWISSRCAQVRGRFREVRIQGGLLLKLGMTIFGTGYREGDSYREMFDRVDQMVTEEKRARKLKKGRLRAAENRRSAGIELDMDLIAREMQEESPMPGAYCQDYDTFRSIYRFMERRLERIKNTAYIILFTLTDEDNLFPNLEHRDYQMNILGEGIQNNLRMGDLYTQYTSCQYLVMVSDVSEENVEMIAQRICRFFYEERRVDAENLVLHHSYPLKSTEKTNK